MRLPHDWFEEHPEEKKRHLAKAHYAYWALNHEEGAHHFPDTTNCKCHLCGRTRSEVRWDQKPAECGSRKPPADIARVLAKEEAKFFSLMERAPSEVPRLIAKLGGLSGGVLAKLHHTYGYDPEIVSTCVGEELIQHMVEYEQSMAEHKSKSGTFKVSNKQ